MRTLVLLCASLWAMALVVPTTPVHAQNLAWVSPNGSDANSCSQTSPCATFAGAISKGGVAEINCLGSGNYGALNSTTVSITDSIVIDCGDGNVGEMTLNGGSEVININASSAATIVLRHLSLNGGDTNNTYGIYTQSFPGGGTLIVEDCMIHGFYVGYGILFQQSGTRAALQVSHSLLYDNDIAIGLFPGSGEIPSVALDGIKLLGSTLDGLTMGGNGTVAGTMRNSLVAENSRNGIYADTPQVYFTVEESSIVDNLDIGIYIVQPGESVSVGASTIGGNGTGVLSIGGASLISFGNNQMSANGVNGTFTSTKALQ